MELIEKETTLDSTWRLKIDNLGTLCEFILERQGGGKWLLSSRGKVAEDGMMVIVGRENPKSEFFFYGRKDCAVVQWVYNECLKALGKE